MQARVMHRDVEEEGVRHGTRVAIQRENAALEVQPDIRVAVMSVEDAPEVRACIASYTRAPSVVSRGGIHERALFQKNTIQAAPTTCNPSPCHHLQNAF